MKYYVLSHGENPIKLFFDEQLAKNAGEAIYDAYLDIFDKQGKKLESLKFVSDGYNEWWTSDF